MTIKQFIDQNNLDKSLLMGYYGGGNYGDELLLEVMANLLSQKGIKNAEIAYLPYCDYSTYHHDFGYRRSVANSIPSLLNAILCSKNIIIGGGGIWGLDTQLKPFLMSAVLFASRWLFGKNVYLLGVGYYKSTNWLGHVGAWMAAKASNTIIGRDQETFENFKRFQPQTYKDKDIAWYLKDIDIETYRTDAEALEKNLPVAKKTLFITLRRFSAKHSNNYTQIINDIIEQHSDKNIIVALLEPKNLDLQNYAVIKAWEDKFSHVKAIDFAYNPIALYVFLQKHRKNLTVVSPQFHAIISAYLQQVPFLPLVYDNKVRELLSQIGVSDFLSIYDLYPDDVNKFINETDQVKA